MTKEVTYSQHRKRQSPPVPPLREQDVVEKFVRSGGRGGQNVNKTSTCVYLKHLPTGIEVKCQRERSQARNREAALCLLAEKVEKAAAAARERLTQQRERDRRRKRPRPARLKERILKSKKKVAEKKQLRGRQFEE
jgi:protein subunit release factor B